MKKWICLLLAAITCFSLVIPAQAADVPTYKVGEPKWVIIDGNVSEKEWGKPIYKGVSLKAAEEGLIDSQVTAWWYDATNNQDTTFDLYVTNNDYGVAFACVVNNVPPEISNDSSYWKLMGFAFSFSKWMDGSGVEVKTTDAGTDEVYTSYRLHLLANGQLKDSVYNLGLVKWNLSRGYEYQIKYDVTTHSLTYEVIVPYKYTNLEITKGNEIAFSAVIALNRDGNTVSASKNGSNRFLIGTGNAHAGKGKFSHKDNCIRIKLATNESIQKMATQNAIQNPNDSTQTLTHNQVLEMYQGPRFGRQEQSGNVLIQWFVIGVSLLVVLLCATTIALVVIKRRKRNTVAEEGNTE